MQEEIKRTAIPYLEKDALDDKAVDTYLGKIVRKDLTALMKDSFNVPTFVLEFLLGQYCSTDDEEIVAQGLARIRKILSENYVRPDESEVIKSKIRELGTYTIIDKVHARLDEHADVYVAQFSNLAIDSFVMPAEYVRDYSKILQGGIWCIVRIEYLPTVEDDFEDDLASIFDEKPKAKSKYKAKRGPEDSPFKVASLKPIQMPRMDMEEFIAQRKKFTTEEWLDFMLRSCGYEPTVLNNKEKLHFIERMVPLIERNYNLCELGPRGTGKSHVYKEISPYAILLSGGQTTTANLFGHMNASRKGFSGVAGLVGNWDCVTFDEVAGMNFKDKNAIQILKDYMASGSFARGRDQLNADASIVYEGNINDSVQNVLKTTHLFDPFPPEFNSDAAFFDRIHCYLPGWEIPKMRDKLLTKHYGLITDCLSEFCREMRKTDFAHHIDNYYRLNNDFNKRDEIGVRKTFSGMAKLLFPDGIMSQDDVRMILEYAIEGRRRVKEQLKIMVGIEFNDVNLGYRNAEGPSEETIIYVPEQKQSSLVPVAELAPGHAMGIGRSVYGDMALYRLENKAVSGDFTLKTEGIGSFKEVTDNIKAAFANFEAKAGSVAVGINPLACEYLLFYRDLQKKGPSAEVSLAEFIGLCSAACNRPVVAGTVIPGALRMSGTIDEIVDLHDIMRIAKNAGAQRIILPTGCAAAYAELPADLMGSISVDFYVDGDPIAAAKKALGI